MPTRAVNMVALSAI